ncbi:MAG: MBL fold metallo-hydrolase [Burkholderiaceae bacterium]
MNPRVPAWLRRVFQASLVLALASCASLPDWYDPTKQHHRPDGFVNTDGTRPSKGFDQFLRWQWETYRSGAPSKPSQVYQDYADFPVLTPNFRNLANPGADPSVTWIGHATTLVQMAGANILTDPHFGERASPVSFAGPKRKVALPAALAQLPRIDVVVISHNHYDHLDVGTIQALAKQAGGPPLFLVPLGVDEWFADLGIDGARAMDWWDAIEVNELRIHFVPVHHWSARGLGDRNETLWGGWVVKTSEASVFFAGDTGYSRDFAEIGARFGGFDLALIPVGAYEPRWFMKEQHVNPEEAVQIHLDVKARRSLGIHWGTFELTDEALDQPILDLNRALKKFDVSGEAFRLLRHGESMEIKP